MKVNIENVSDTQRKLTIEIDAERINEEFGKLYNELRKKAHIPGFRPGKVPKSVLQMRMGEEIALQIGMDLIEETLPEAAQKIEDETVGQPTLGEWTVEEGKPFVYDATFEILPPIELKEYKGLEVPKQPIEIRDEEIDEGLERIREGQATFEVVKDRAVEKGDRIYGRLTFNVEGTPLPGWKNRHVEIDVGEESFFPGSGIEELLVGAPVEGEHAFTVTFPEDYDYYKDVAGKTIDAVMQINDVKVKSRPEINDDLAKDLGLENMDDLKKMVTEDIRKRREREVDEAFETALFDALEAKNAIPAPAPMVTHEAEFVVENYFSYQGEIPAEQKQKLVESVRPMAEKRVKQRLALKRIAELEKIEVTDDDVNDAIREMAESDGSNPDDVRSKWEEEGLMEGLKKQVLQSKTLKWLKDNVVAVEPAPGKEQETDDGKEE